MSLLKDAQSESNLHLLNSQEKADPYLVIEELFDFAHLPDIREILWAWLKATVTGSYPKKLTHSERAEILDLYEKLEKLIEKCNSGIRVNLLILHNFNYFFFCLYVFLYRLISNIFWSN